MPSAQDSMQPLPGPIKHRHCRFRICERTDLLVLKTRLKDVRASAGPCHGQAGDPRSLRRVSSVAQLDARRLTRRRDDRPCGRRRTRSVSRVVGLPTLLVQLPRRSQGRQRFVATGARRRARRSTPDRRNGRQRPSSRSPRDTIEDSARRAVPQRSDAASAADPTSASASPSGRASSERLVERRGQGRRIRS